MKRFISLALLAVGSLAQAATVSMSVDFNSKPLGTATLTGERLAGGQLRSTMEMRLNAQGMSMVHTQVNVYDRRGRPVSSTVTSSAAAGSAKITATYGANSVVVKATTGPKSASREIAYPAGASIERRSELWFVVVKPRPGTVLHEIAFETSTGKWHKQDISYAGTRSIKWSGRTVKAHYMTVKELGSKNGGEMWVDDQGMPYRLHLNQGGAAIKMERVSPQAKGKR